MRNMQCMETIHAGQESTFNLDAREIIAGVVFAHFLAVCVRLGIRWKDGKIISNLQKVMQKWGKSRASRLSALHSTQVLSGMLQYLWGLLALSLQPLLFTHSTHMLVSLSHCGVAGNCKKEQDLYEVARKLEGLEPTVLVYEYEYHLR